MSVFFFFFAYRPLFAYNPDCQCHRVQSRTITRTAMQIFKRFSSTVCLCVYVIRIVDESALIRMIYKSYARTVSKSHQFIFLSNWYAFDFLRNFSNGIAKLEKTLLSVKPLCVSEGRHKFHIFIISSALSYRRLLSAFT